MKSYFTEVNKTDFFSLINHETLHFDITEQTTAAACGVIRMEKNFAKTVLKQNFHGGCSQWRHSIEGK